MRTEVLMNRIRLALLASSVAVLSVACGGDSNGNGGGGDEPDAGEDASEDTGEDTSDCTPGELDCSCDEGACGEGLVCSDDTCVEDTGCDPGTTDCVCTGDGGCLDEADECIDGMCMPRTDCDGELGCACNDDGTCDEGLECSDGLCTSADALTVFIEGADLRACDILLDTPGLAAMDVSFPAGVRGRYRARGERTALALIATEDSAISGPVGAVVFDGEAGADAVGAISATCYDRLGQPVDGVVPTAR